MILVTGAAGKTGRAVLAALSQRGLETRALVRKPEQREDLSATEVLVGDMTDPATIEAALSGVVAVYLICPNVHPAELEIAKAWIATAQASGLRRFVYHSVLFPQIEAMPHHWQKLRAEETLIRSGLGFTILQPASYMQNISGYVSAMRETGEYRVPYSVNTEFTHIDLQDVAEVAAKVITESGHSGAIYSLAGPDLLSSAEMAAQIGERLGVKVQAVKQSIEEWRASASGMSEYGRETLIKMFEYYDQHGFASSSTILQTLLGRAPTRFADFLNREVK